MTDKPKVPDDFPVKEIGPDDMAVDRVTCGECGRSWDDGLVTSWTPAPSGRCPFEYYHKPASCQCETGPEWSGSPNPANPDNEWICDDCNRVIAA